MASAFHRLRPLTGTVIRDLVGQVDSALQHTFPSAPATPAVKAKPESDLDLAADAHQFFRVNLLDHVERCTVGNCHNDTRAAVESDTDGGPRAICPCHIWVLFADWMVGV